jgi:hypothetical protein
VFLRRTEAEGSGRCHDQGLRLNPIMSNKVRNKSKNAYGYQKETISAVAVARRIISMIFFEV